MKRIDKEDYNPIIVRNPYEKMFVRKMGGWDKVASTWYFQYNEI